MCIAKGRGTPAHTHAHARPHTAGSMNLYVDMGANWANTLRLGPELFPGRDAWLTVAFEASPLPVTLSLEMHCTEEGQKEVARILTKTFAEYLLMPDDEQASGLADGALCSPGPSRVTPPLPLLLCLIFCERRKREK